LIQNTFVAVGRPILNTKSIFHPQSRSKQGRASRQRPAGLAFFEHGEHLLGSPAA
jgi:hypothetical protein